MEHRTHSLVRLVPFLAAMVLAAWAALPANSQEKKEEPALPTERVVIDIDAPEREVFRIGIPDLMGWGSKHAITGSEVLRNDFRIMPGYRVIGPGSITHDLAKEGPSIQPGIWSRLGANGVVKGSVRERTGQLQVELRFYKVSDTGSPALTRNYTGDPKNLRSWMHKFGNDVLRVITGTPGPFGTRIAFARRRGPGNKDVYVGGMDGHGVKRVSGGTGVSMLPSFANGAIWFTRMTQRGVFITHGSARGRRIIGGVGIQMAPAVCGGRVYFTSTRDSNSEIYSSMPDGSNVSRLTRHPGIDVSPVCGPGGKLAFVSNRHGTPQVFTMNRNGSDVRRVTFRGSYNQTPSWCSDPKTPLITFTGRDGGLDVFTVNLETQEYTRITQGQGENKDPAFSPDCRVIAFSSSRRGAAGIYLASPKGLDQVSVVKGRAETIRWEH